MKSEYLIKKQITSIRRQMKRDTPGQAFSMMVQVVNALNWVMGDGNDPSKVLADMAHFESSLIGRDAQREKSSDGYSK